MSLDKWLKSEREAKKEKTENKERLQVRKSKSESMKKSEKPTMKLVKFTLNCPNVKCKYQKTIMKKKLTDIDRICPRCNKEMRVKS